MPKNTKTCPFCGDEVLEVAKKCRHCGEWFTNEGKVDDLIIKLKTKKAKELSKKVYVTKRKIQWFRILIGLAFMFLVVAIGLYEKNAQEVLSYSQKVESAGKYKTAAMGYQIIIEKFWMSFAIVDAKEYLRRIKSRTGFSPDKRLGTTLAERYINWFNPYVHYGLPIVACFVCCPVLIIGFLRRLFVFRFALFRLLIGFAAGVLFLSQMIASGVIDSGVIDIKNFNEMNFARLITQDASNVFVFCYLLIVVSMGMTIVPLRKRAG